MTLFKDVFSTLTSSDFCIVSSECTVLTAGQLLYIHLIKFILCRYFCKDDISVAKLAREIVSTV